MNFAEVLFAIMILGIGFIMVAAIFPVAIQQSKSNTDETVATRMAVATVEAVRPYAKELSVSGEVDMILPTSEIGPKILETFIYPNDPRYGQSLLYRHVNNNSAVQLFVVSMQVGNRSRYDKSDFTVPTFQPLEVYVALEERLENQDAVYFYTGDDISSGLVAPNSAIDTAAAAGAVLVIGNNPSRPELNGRVYTLSEKVDTGEWLLQRGSDMYYHADPDGDPGTSDSIDENIPAYAVGGSPGPTEKTARAYLIGRGIDPSTTWYAGTNQAINVHTAIIPLR